MVVVVVVVLVVVVAVVVEVVTSLLPELSVSVLSRVQLPYASRTDVIAIALAPPMRRLRTLDLLAIGITFTFLESIISIFDRIKKYPVILL